jgi:hypothetical protein
MRFCRRYWCCSSLRHGNPAHSSLGLASGALVSSMRLALLHSTISGLRQHILDITLGLGFSDHPTEQMHAVGTCSRSRPFERAICWLLRSDSSFCVAVGSCCPPGFVGVSTDHRYICRPLSLSSLDQASRWLHDTCVNSLWLVSCNDGSGADSLALAIATC